MKKNISINISGIIFHIEEDGYDKLKNYLSSINTYFSSYEDSAEIIADIESRIAEIFLAKLGDSKQVITLDDVNDLIATMGTVSDFEAAEEQAYEPYEEARQEARQDARHSRTTHDTQGPAPGKKLYRDLNRKVVAGVCAGLAHYIGVDALWVRLAFLATFFDLLYVVSISGIAVATYLVLWAITPGSTELSEDTRIKRLFRDPDHRVLGGVASGLAAYFGIEVNLVRVLFVAGMLFGGTGLVIYLIFWAITPEAKTLTDRMQMEGEPVTLSNIEKKIKESLNIDAEEEETLLTRILLFPFRLLARLIDMLGGTFKSFGSFVRQALRLFAGISMSALALIVVLVVLMLGAVSIGLYAAPSEMQIDGVPLAMLHNSIPFSGVFFALLIVLIPFFSLGLAGLSLLARQRIVGAAGAWTLFGLWLAGLAGAALTVPRIVAAWQQEGTQRTETMYQSASMLDLLPNTDGFGEAELTVRGYEGNKIKLVKIITSRGSNRENVMENTRMVNYPIEQHGDTLLFGKAYTLGPEGLFRGQQVRLELYVPYGKAFTMTDELSTILRSTLYPYGYSARDLEDGRRWVFEESGLKCLDCPAQTAQATENEPTENAHFEATEMDGYVKEMDGLNNFTRVNVHDMFEVEIAQGKEFQIILNGDRELVAATKVSLHQGELDIKYEGKTLHLGMEPVKVYIAMPGLEGLQLSGASHAKVRGFSGNKAEFLLSGAVECQADVNFKELNGILSGKSSLMLEGNGQKLDLALSGASEVNAFDFEAETVNVSASGKSMAEVHANKQVQIASADASEVVYKGAPKVITGTGNFSKAE